MDEEERRLSTGDVPVPPPVTRTTSPLTEKRLSGLSVVDDFDGSDMMN
jgi:hypothetical protein